MTRRLLLAVTALFCVSAFAQTSVTPILQPRQFFPNSVGAPCSGCSLYSYAAGTTTPQATYTDSSGNVQNTNPVVLDVAGSAQIWMGNKSYKFVLKDALGNTIWTVDNVNAGAPYVTQSGGSLTGGIIGPSATFGSADGVLHPAICGTSNKASWCSGADLGAWTNASLGQLGVGGGRIDLSGQYGSWNLANTIQVTQPGADVFLGCATISGTSNLESVFTVTSTSATSNQVSITGNLTSGEVPLVMALATITGTTNGSGHFNQSLGRVTSVTANGGSSYTITYFIGGQAAAEPFASGSTTVTIVGPPTGFMTAGQTVTGTGIPANTTISSVASTTVNGLPGYTVTLSQATNATTTAVEKLTLTLANVASASDTGTMDVWNPLIQVQANNVSVHGCGRGSTYGATAGGTILNGYGYGEVVADGVPNKSGAGYRFNQTLSDFGINVASGVNTNAGVYLGNVSFFSIDRVTYANNGNGAYGFLLHGAEQGSIGGGNILAGANVANITCRVFTYGGTDRQACANGIDFGKGITLQNGSTSTTATNVTLEPDCCDDAHIAFAHMVISNNALTNLLDYPQGMSTGGSYATFGPAIHFESFVQSANNPNGWGSIILDGSPNVRVSQDIIGGNYGSPFNAIALQDYSSGMIFSQNAGGGQFTIGSTVTKTSLLDNDCSNLNLTNNSTVYTTRSNRGSCNNGQWGDTKTVQLSLNSIVETLQDDAPTSATTRTRIWKGGNASASVNKMADIWESADGSQTLAKTTQYTNSGCPYTWFGPDATGNTQWWFFNCTGFGINGNLTLNTGVLTLTAASVIHKIENGSSLTWYSDGGSTPKAAVYGDSGVGTFSQLNIGAPGSPNYYTFGNMVTPAGAVPVVAPQPITATAGQCLTGLSATNGAWTTATCSGGGGGGTTTNALTVNNSGAGAASGTTFNGSSPVTISYNTTGAQPAFAVSVQTASSVTMAGPWTYYYNKISPVTTAVTYTLPAPAAGTQICVKNANASGSAVTSAITVAPASPSTQSIDWNGSLTTSTGYVVSGGAAGDGACFIGITSTQWEMYVNAGSWTTH